MTTQEWSIQEIARSAGTTSRTLRHYGDIGLLEPSRVGHNGYRYYDLNALLRLQRILLLRDLGLGLTGPSARCSTASRTASRHLSTHLMWLERERERIGRQIESVKTTLRKLEGGEQVMASEALDGFDHTQYKDEVIERWGREAYEQGDRWWKSMSEGDKQAFQQEQAGIAKAFADALKAGKSAESDEAQAITQRQYDWITVGWQGNRPGAAQFAGLGQIYVDEPGGAADPPGPAELRFRG